MNPLQASALILSDDPRLLQTDDAFRECRCVDLSAVVDKAGLLAAFAEGLDFPYYFGGNWDALDECIHDLEWLRPGPIRVAVTGSVAILRLNGRDRVVLKRILLREEAEYDRGVVWVVFDDVRVLRRFRWASRWSRVLHPVAR